jgi:peptidoglycan/LPS O-acetylase OafA/YrhL
MQPTETYRKEIDGLRAIAICGVILYHNFPYIIRGGFLGVDIFFVISGFLISSIIFKEVDQGIFNLSNFWERRIRRIYPALLSLIIVTLILTYFIYLPIDFQGVGRSVVSLSLAASNIYFWLKTDYFGPTADIIPLLHTWSLSVEAQFYFFFPLLILGVQKLREKHRVVILFTLLTLSILLCILVKGEAFSTAFFLLPHRAWELLIGSLLATNLIGSSLRNTNRFYLEGLTAIGLLLILSSFIFLQGNRDYELTTSLIPCIGTALIILSNTGQVTLFGNILTLKPMSYIGKISYPLYLWHWTFLVLVKYDSLNMLQYIEKLEVLTIVFIVSAISYHFLELPFRRKLFMKSQHSLFIFLTASLVFLFVIGTAINKTGGVPSRLDKSILKKYQEAFKEYSANCSFQNLNNQLCSKTPLEKDPDIILWGDSHASALAPVFDSLATKYNVNVWHYGCYPVLGVYRADKKNDLSSHTSCYNINNEFLNYIKDYKVKNIVFASFWTQFTDRNEVPIKGNGQSPIYYSDQSTKSNSRWEAQKVFKVNFENTIDVLTKLNIHVYILKQVPQHLNWIPNQLVKFERNGWNLDLLGRPLKEHTERQKFVNSVFENISALNNHVTILDATDLLCQPNSFCKGSAEEHSLYRDYSHLSLYGSYFLQPIFEPLFEEISSTKIK